jgi:hypothetical protein
MILHLVAQAAGRPEIPRPTRSMAASIRFLVAGTAGLLVEVAGAGQARRQPGVVEVGLTRGAGQEIHLRQSFQDRLGYVIAAAADGPAAARAADAGVRALQARIAPAAPVLPEGPVVPEGLAR